MPNSDFERAPGGIGTAELYRQLFRDAPEAQLLTDSEGRIIDLNREAERLFGPSALRPGSALAELLTDDAQAELAAELGLLASHADPRKREPPPATDARALRLERPEGGPIDAQPTPTGSAGTIHWRLWHAGSRDRTSDELRQGMARLRSILESAVDGIIAIDHRGTVTLFNPSAERMFGYDASEVLGQNLRMLMPQPHRREHDGYLERYLRTGERKIIGIGREVAGLRKNGQTFPMDLAVSEVQMGADVSFVGMVRDITERKAIREALRRERDFAESLLDTAQAIVLVLDCEGRIVRYNPYMEKISGIPLDEVRGQSWFEQFLPPGDWEEIRRVFERSLAGEPTRGYVNPILTRGGEPKDIEWFDTRIRDAEGRVTGLLAVGQDLTPRQRLEEQIRQSQKLEAIGRLAGGVAHDFNTILGSIRGYSELVLDQARTRGLPPEVEEAARQVHEASSKGAALTRQLLAFSRRQVLTPKVCDLNAIVERMDGLLTRLVSAEVRLTKRLYGEPLPIEVDANQIEQVIMNLVVNACDAMPQGGTIVLGTERVLDDRLAPADSPRASERAGSSVARRHDPTTAPSNLGPPPAAWAELRVVDTGTGMDEATRRKLFDPFFTTKEPGKGTGLGLSLVYGIVNQSRGSIQVETELGKGSAFRVLLPLTSAPIEIDAGETTEPVAGASASERVLLVEDDAMFRGLLTQVLVARGYRVTVAENPRVALEQCASLDSPPDLLVTDIVMPGGTNGLELAEQLRGRYPRLRVLLMSGYTDDDLAEPGELWEIEGLGAESEFLSKPFGTHEFARRVRRLLDRAAPDSKTSVLEPDS